MIGDVDFGPDVELRRGRATLDWYDYLFKGAQNEFAGKPVKLFVMGANQWRDEDDWPLARARRHEVLPALGRQGEFAARQRHAVDDRAGGGGRGSIRLRSGEPRADDRRAALLRRRAPASRARGISAPCRSARRCAGVFDAAAGSGHGSHRAGDARAVCEVVGGGYRLHGQARGRLARWLRAEPDRGHPAGAVSRLAGEAVAHHAGAGLQADGGVWSTSNVFKKGHVLRLEVSSSNFPRFDRNLNTGEDNGTGTRFVSATNSVLHDAQHPSALVLPVVRD